MMKLNKRALKELIKECIVEVLSDGISEISSTKSTLSESSKAIPRTNSRDQRSNKKSPSRPKALDRIKFDRAADNVATSMTQDPVMQSIFADTVKTTLQDQYASEKNKVVVPPNADRATLLAAEADPSQLFEGSSNWASLAFTEPLSPAK